MRLKPIPPARRVPREPATPAMVPVLPDEPLTDAAAEIDVTGLLADAPADPPAQPAGPGAVSDVRGLIDNATADRIYGWAWDSGHPHQRLRVELRLAGEPVATVTADGARPDLAKNGVGDGNHAFDFAMRPEWYERRTELTVCAFGVDGSEFPIAVRIRRRDDAEVATTLQRQIETALAEQAAIRAEFAAIRERATLLPEVPAVEAIGTAQEELVRKVDGLEVWLTRLDAKLGDAAGGQDGAGAGRLDPWQAVLIAVLASAASAALALAAARWLV